MANDMILSVRRASRLLSAIAGAAGPRTAAELALDIGLNRSTAYHLLNTLEAEGLVMRGEDRRYRLGAAILSLAASLTAGELDSPRLIEQLEQLTRRTRETSYLVAWRGEEITVLAIRLGLQPIVASDNITTGYSDNAHARASGKAILAFSNPGRVHEYIRTHPLTALTSHTVADAEAFEQQLREVREQGFAVEEQEYAEGLSCIAAPILSANGVARGAFSVSIPVSRFEVVRDATIKEVTAAGRDASTWLAGQRPAPSRISATSAEGHGYD